MQFISCLVKEDGKKENKNNLITKAIKKNKKEIYYYDTM